MLQLLSDRLEQSQTRIHRSELLLLGAMFMTDMFAQGVRGEIVQFVFTYF
jgi:hypothetical protein